MVTLAGDVPTRVVRWTARIWALLSAAFILLIFLGEGASEGIGPFLAMDAREIAMMVAFVAFWIGLLLGWRRELLGGGLVLAGMLAFYLLDYLFSASWPRGLVFPLLSVPGLLYLAAAWLAHRDEPLAGAA